MNKLKQANLKYYREHPIEEKEFNKLFTNKLVEKYRLIIEDKKVLDVGCGIGKYGIIDIYAKNYLGIDLSKENVERNPYPSFRMDIEDTTFKDKQFDLIFINNSLHHFFTSKARQEIHRIGKTYLFIEPNPNSYIKKVYPDTDEDLHTHFSLFKFKLHFKGKIEYHHYLLPFLEFRLKKYCWILFPLFYFIDTILSKIPIIKTFGDIIICRGELENNEGGENMVRKEDEEKEEQPQVMEIPINLELINNKLNGLYTELQVVKKLLQEK